MDILTVKGSGKGERPMNRQALDRALSFSAVSVTLNNKKQLCALSASGDHIAQ